MVYLIHKFKLKQENIEKAKKYIKIFLENKIPIIYTPPVWFVGAEIDEEEVMQLCFDIIDRADALVVCGDTDSRGVQREIEYGMRIGKPIYMVKSIEEAKEVCKRITKRV